MVQVIREMPLFMAKLLHVLSDTECRDFQLSPYTISVAEEKGLLVFSTLTGALLFLDGIASEEKLCEAAQSDDNLRKQMLLYRILIPGNFDERQFCDQLRSLHLGEEKRRLRGHINSYVIFTTTACNANCYYCFEHGYAPVTMTEETALQAAAYIEAHAADEVMLTWFGGEPLVNPRAIDVITGYLADHNISFQSRIVTNGYLFTPEMIRKAKDQWHLISAQIALDGTRDNYNRIKAYAGGNGDAYDRVIRNMETLADLGISVFLLLNLSRENEQDLYELLRELKLLIIGHRQQFRIDPNLLQQYSGTEEESEMQQKLYALKQWLAAQGLAATPILPEYLRLHACRADYGAATVIQADGGLNCCDHITESRPYGSIFSDQVDDSVIAWWEHSVPTIPECDKCVLYPQCRRLAHCPITQNVCTEIRRRQEVQYLKEAMEYYRKYRSMEGAEGKEVRR